MMVSALTLIPLTFVIIIGQTFTFWVSLFGCCIFKEALHPLEIMGMVVCFACVVLITLQGAQNEEESTDQAAGADEEPADEQTSDGMQIVGFLLIFGYSLLYAVRCAANRGLKGTLTSVVIFWHGLCGLILAVVAILIEHYATQTGGLGKLRVLNYGSTTYLYLISATVLDVMQSFMSTFAFINDSGGFISLISYIAIAYGFFSDSLIFGEEFTYVEVLLVLTILLTTVGVSVFKIMDQRKKNKIA